MKVIARIICRQNVLGIDGIPGDSIKIDDAIKGAAFPDPLIDCLTLLFLYLIVVTIEWVAVERILEWCQGRADDAHPVGMGRGLSVADIRK